MLIVPLVAGGRPIGVLNLVWAESGRHFEPEDLGCHRFTVEAWVDHFGSWARDLAKRVEAGQDVKSELLEGAELVRQAARRASGADGGTRGDGLSGVYDATLQHPGAQGTVTCRLVRSYSAARR